MIQRFDISPTPIAGACVVSRVKIGDDRGFLTRLFCAQEMAAIGWKGPISQINHVRNSKAGTVRGVHYQYPPFAEQKLVMCIKGAIHDVCVDLRHGSETFLQHHSERLSDENMAALLIPEGCGHAYQALTDEVEMIYLHSAPYYASAEGGCLPTDPKIGISWPQQISHLSARDSRHPPLTDDFTGLKT